MNRKMLLLFLVCLLCYGLRFNNILDTKLAISQIPFLYENELHMDKETYLFSLSNVFPYTYSMSTA